MMSVECGGPWLKGSYKLGRIRRKFFAVSRGGLDLDCFKELFEALCMPVPPLFAELRVEVRSLLEKLL